MGKFILHLSGGNYTFSFHAASGDKIAVSPPCITRSSAQQAMNETRIASERTDLFRRLQKGGEYYFELYNETEKLLLISEKYETEEERDCAMKILLHSAISADYAEPVY